MSTMGADYSVVRSQRGADADRYRLLAEIRMADRLAVLGRVLDQRALELPAPAEPSVEVKHDLLVGVHQAPLSVAGSGTNSRPGAATGSGSGKTFTRMAVTTAPAGQSARAITRTPASKST